MSFTSLTVDIDATGSPIDRAMNNINTQTKSDNHINDIVNGIAPSIQSGGGNPYKKIFDLNNMKYVSINTKRGKKIVNSYIKKLKYL